MEEINKQFQNNPLPNDIVQYFVYTKDDSTGECVFNYVGNDYNEANNIFVTQSMHLKFTKHINKNACVIFEDCFNDKIIKTFKNDTN